MRILHKCTMDILHLFMQIAQCTFVAQHIMIYLYSMLDLQETSAIMENKTKKNSDARIKANNKYNAKTYKKLQVSAKIADYETIDNYCKINNISKANFVINSCLYAIKNSMLFSNSDETDNT